MLKNIKTEFYKGNSIAEILKHYKIYVGSKHFHEQQLLDRLFHLTNLVPNFRLHLSPAFFKTNNRLERTLFVKLKY